jgi:predicted dienelactone hydrolase
VYAKIMRPAQIADRSSIFFPFLGALMRCPKFLFATAFCFAVSTAQAAGLEAFDIPAGAAGPAIRGRVWTPCAESPQEIDDKDGRTFFAVQDCPITGDKLPLIVISQGGRGWLAGHDDTAAALADAGFIVLAINHPGDTSSTDSLAVLVEWPADIKRSIDFMLERWPDASHVDAQRIGFYGFSFGGYTGLVVIGGNPDFRKGLPDCQTSSLQACKELENNEIPTQPIIHDPRVKAAIIVDPYPVFVFPKENLKAVTIPVELWGSDPTQNADHLSGCCAAAIYDRLPSKSKFIFMKDARHYSFLAVCTPKEAVQIPSICTDAPGFDRAGFHKSFHAEAVAFFRKHLGEIATP